MTNTDTQEDCRQGLRSVVACWRAQVRRSDLVVFESGADPWMEVKEQRGENGR